MRALISAVLFVLMALGVTPVFAQGAGQGADQSPPPAAGQGKEHRIAFVVGNETYAAGALPTAANDAGLVAQTLQAAGFEVVGARDLDAETLRQSYADFVKKVSDAGPDTVAFVYLAGYGVQYGTDNFFVPIGATIARDADIPIESIRLSDLTGPLVTMNLKARFFVFDGAYKTPFKPSGAPLAEGFSLVDASPGTLIAYNSAPGTVAPIAKGNYGLYAQSLAAMLREGGLPPDEIFDRVRLRVNDQSKGAEVPWDVSKIDAAFRFFERGKNAPPPAATPEQTAALTQKPLKELPVLQAYTAAVARDTIQSYEQFTAVYPRDPLARRVRVLLAARREAITWRRTIAIDTPPAYWSYLSRYPHGPHAFDARLRLEQLSAQEAPPPDYQAIVYDVPPPPPEELDFVDQPVVYFEDPEFVDFAPPPPPPDYWLPPVPVAFIDLPPPPPPVGLFILPVPAFVPLPVYYDPPPYVVYPTQNYFYGSVGGAGVPYEERFQRLHEGFPAGGPRFEGSGANRGALIGAAAVGAAAVALPAAALARTNALERRGITTPAQLNALRREPGGVNGLNRPGGPGAPGAGGPAGLNPAARNALPGANGRPLPAANAQRAPGANAPAGARPGEAERRPGQPGAGGPQDRRGGAAGRPQGGPGAAPLDRRPGAQDRQQRGPDRQQNARERQQERGQERQQRLQDRRNAIEQRRQERQAGPQRQERNAAPERREAPRGAEPRNAVQQRVQERGRPGGAPGGGREPFRAPQERAAPGPRPGGFGGGPGPRPGGFPGGGAPHPGGFPGGGGPRPGGFGGGGMPHPGGGGFGGGGGGPRPGGFGGGGMPHPGGGGGGGPHPGGGGGGGHPGFPGHP